MDGKTQKSDDNGSIKEAAKQMDDTKKLPPDSKMEKAVEQAKDAGAYRGLQRRPRS
jgi:hypothetical protein